MNTTSVHRRLYTYVYNTPPRRGETHTATRDKARKGVNAMRYKDRRKGRNAALRAEVRREGEKKLLYEQKSGERGKNAALRAEVRREERNAALRAGGKRKGEDRTHALCVAHDSCRSILTIEI
jgi:hypothetical protein